jgi:hypothetical protein
MCRVNSQNNNNNNNNNNKSNARFVALLGSFTTAGTSAREVTHGRAVYETPLPFCGQKESGRRLLSFMHNNCAVPFCKFAPHLHVASRFGTGILRTRGSCQTLPGKALREDTRATDLVSVVWTPRRVSVSQPAQQRHGLSQYLCTASLGTTASVVTSRVERVPEH